MVQFYVMRIRLDKLTLPEVPERCLPPPAGRAGRALCCGTGCGVWRCRP